MNRFYVIRSGGILGMFFSLLFLSSLGEVQAQTRLTLAGTKASVELNGTVSAITKEGPTDGVLKHSFTVTGVGETPPTIKVKGFGRSKVSLQKKYNEQVEPRRLESITVVFYTTSDGKKLVDAPTTDSDASADFEG